MNIYPKVYPKEIKKILMQEALRNGDGRIAYQLLYADLVCVLANALKDNEFVVCAYNDDVKKVYETTMKHIGSEYTTVDPRGIEGALESSEKYPQLLYHVILDEEEFARPSVLAALARIAEGELGNIRITLLYTGFKRKEIKGSAFLPLFMNKLDAMQVVRPYQIWTGFIGEGWGSKYENNQKTLGKKVTKKIYNDWLKNIEKIEADREAERLKLLETKDGDTAPKA